MNYIDSLKYLSKEPLSQYFQYLIFKNDYKIMAKHPLAYGSIDKLYNYQQKINIIYSHLLNNLDNYVQEPKKYLQYIHDSIMLQYSYEDISNIYQDEFNGLNINLNILSSIFNEQEYKKICNNFSEMQTLENAIPLTIQNARYLDSEKFSFKLEEACKQFGLAGIIVPKVLQTEDFFINLEKNILFLSQQMLIQSQAFGKLNTIFLIDDKDYSGLDKDMYDNIEKRELSDLKNIFKINTNAFSHNNFVNMPHEKLQLFIENVSKKKQYKN